MNFNPANRNAIKYVKYINMRSFFLSAILLLSTNFIRAQQLILSKDDLYAYEGTFDLGNNHRITLGIFDEFKSLVYLDLKTLKLGALIPLENNLFRDNNDSSMFFQFLRDKNNNVEGLKISKNSLPLLLGKRVSPHTTQSVSFVSGKQTLKGDLYIPTSKGSHPAVVGVGVRF